MSDPAPPLSVAEIMALAERLRSVDEVADRAAILAGDRLLIDRITQAADRANRSDARTRSFAEAALLEVARARATHEGYVLVGPSARTWRADRTTGAAVEPVSDAEHGAVRVLLGEEWLAMHEPTWAALPDGRTDITANVHPAWESDHGDPLDRARAAVEALPGPDAIHTCDATASGLLDQEPTQRPADGDGAERGR